MNQAVMSCCLRFEDQMDLISRPGRFRNANPESIPFPAKRRFRGAGSAGFLIYTGSHRHRGSVGAFRRGMEFKFVSRRQAEIQSFPDGQAGGMLRLLIIWCAGPSNPGREIPLYIRHIRPHGFQLLRFSFGIRVGVQGDVPQVQRFPF